MFPGRRPQAGPPGTGSNRDPMSALLAAAGNRGAPATGTPASQFMMDAGGRINFNAPGIAVTTDPRGTSVQFGSAGGMFSHGPGQPVHRLPPGAVIDGGPGIQPAAFTGGRWVTGSVIDNIAGVGTFVHNGSGGGPPHQAVSLPTRPGVHTVPGVGTVVRGVDRNGREFLLGPPGMTVVGTDGRPWQSRG